MKKFINNPEEVVRESLEGMAVAHSQNMKVHFNPDFIYRSDAPLKGKVSIISGGGSGHEPLHSGFVGSGMLDGACPGQIFTSPTPDQMFLAAKTVHGGAGVLFIVKNYSGDVMNFEMAADLVRAEGIPVDTVLLDDDVAVSDSLYTQGRRGVGNTVLAEKICGAAAEKGYTLKGLADLGRRINQNGRSMGIALSSCIVPARGVPTFELSENEVEIGIGIHGEPGRERIKMEQADIITSRLALSIIEDGEYTRTQSKWNEDKGSWEGIEVVSPPFKPGDKILAFVNGMGGTPVSELYIVYRKLAEICEQKKLRIVRNLIGTYMTSLEMQGCSITLLKVDEEMVQLWDDPVCTPALRWGT